MQMWGERNCLSFETAVSAIETPSARLTVRRSTAKPPLPKWGTGRNLVLLDRIHGLHLVRHVIEKRNQQKDPDRYKSAISVVPGLFYRSANQQNYARLFTYYRHFLKMHTGSEKLLTPQASAVTLKQ